MDSCPSNLSGEDVYEMLMLNFKRHYLSNRAPMGLHFHTSWFQTSTYFHAFNVRYFSSFIVCLHKFYILNIYSLILLYVYLEIFGRCTSTT